MILLTTLGLVFICFVVLVLLTRHLSTAKQIPVTADWIDELSVDRYRPMLRLLDAEDFEFLRGQLGFTPAMEKSFRDQRCKVFTGYLRCLEADFGQVCTAIKILMTQSMEDRPDLAGMLLRSRWTFTWRLLLVRLQVLCYRHGIAAVNAKCLLTSFDGIRLELRTMIPADMSAGA